MKTSQSLSAAGAGIRQASEVALCLETSTKVVTTTLFIPVKLLSGHTAYSFKCCTFVGLHLNVRAVSHAIIKSGVVAAQSILEKLNEKCI